MDADILLAVGTLYVFLVWALGELSNRASRPPQ